jgi:hypothetical protein
VKILVNEVRSQYSPKKIAISPQKMPLKPDFKFGPHRACKSRENKSMKDSTRDFRHVWLILAAVLSLAGAATAYATDTYNTSTHVLTIPKVAIGAATYSNMIVNVGTIVSPPSGTSPNSSEDSYDPASGQLTVAAVKVGNNTFFNVVVNVTGMVSVGSVTGADTFDGTHLTVASVQLANAAYTNVVLAVGLSNIVQLAGGMPSAGQDQYVPGAPVHSRRSGRQHSPYKRDFICDGGKHSARRRRWHHPDLPGKRRPAQLLCGGHVSHQ